VEHDHEHGKSEYYGVREMNRYRPTLRDRFELTFIFITPTLAAIGLIAVIVLVVSVSRAGRARADTLDLGSTHADSKPDSCFAGEGERVSLRGTIVQSITLEANDGTGEPAHTKFTAVALEKAVCFSKGPSAPQYVIRICSDIPEKKWLGHSVTLTGTLYIDEDLCFTVEHIKDAPK
jgi:hypothetical protein